MSDTVKCSEVQKQCVYSVNYGGGGYKGYSFCEYIAVTGKRRGCDPEQCDKFKKKGKR